MRNSFPPPPSPSITLYFLSLTFYLLSLMKRSPVIFFGKTLTQNETVDDFFRSLHLFSLDPINNLKRSEYRNTQPTVQGGWDSCCVCLCLVGGVGGLLGTVSSTENAPKFEKKCSAPTFKRHKKKKKVNLFSINWIFCKK